MGQIRCGLYRRDIAQVQDFDENEEFYNLKVVPRIKPPHPNDKTRKTSARIQIDRPTPRRSPEGGCHFEIRQELSERTG